MTWRAVMMALALVLASTVAAAVVVPTGPAEPVLLHCADQPAGPRCTDVTALLAEAGRSHLTGALSLQDGSALLFGDGGRIFRLPGNQSAPRAALWSELSGSPGLTALWTSPDERVLWAGDRAGVVYARTPDGTWKEAIRLASAATATPRAVTAGWASASGAMWVAAGDTAHLLRWKPDGTVVAAATLEDSAPSGGESTIVGVAGKDDRGSGWTVALADDGGRILLLDDHAVQGARIALPPIVTLSRGKPAIRGELQIYRGLEATGTKPDGTELWATAWYGRLRRLFLGDNAIASECGGVPHGCIIEPSLVAANDLVDPETGAREPVRVQLNSSSTNGVTRGPGGEVWVVGDNGLVARRKPGVGGTWAKAVTGLEAEPHLNLLRVWSGAEGVWVLGERLCPGRNQRPADGVAHLPEYRRPEDPDDTNAFQCALLALCPSHTGAPCGGVLEVPSGEFVIHEPLVLDSETWIAGEGASSVIEWQGTGSNEFGGMKAAIDIRGRLRGACPANDCRDTMIFPPAADDYVNPMHGRGPAGLRDLIVRNGRDGCRKGGHRSGSIGLDLHSGFDPLSWGNRPFALRNLQVCGFEAGVRLTATAINGTIRRLDVRNNHVGLNVELALQWSFEDINAEENDLGILMNDGQDTFLHGARLVANSLGGLLVTRGYPVIDGVTARDNVHGESGFDLALVSGRSLMPEGPAFAGGARKNVEPVFGQAARPLQVTTSNLTLLGGADGAPGRIVAVSLRGDRGRCGIGRFTLRNVASRVPPLLDVLDECPLTSALLLENAPVSLRQLSLPEAGVTKDAGSPVTAALPAFAWASARTPAPASGALAATPTGPALRLTRDGQVRIGGLVMPEAESADQSKASARVTIRTGADRPGPPELLAVDGAGQVLRFDGREWTAAEIGWRGGTPLNAIWTSTVEGKEESWVVGDQGVILRSRGREPFEQWSSESNRKAGGDALPEANLNALWGVDGSHLWVVGDDGVILRWDGLAWHRLPSRTRASLRGVSGYVHTRQGKCSVEVWAAGADSTVLQATSRCESGGEEAFRPAPFEVPPGREFLSVVAVDEQDVLLAASHERVLQATLDSREGRWSVSEVASLIEGTPDRPEVLWGVNILDGSSAFVLGGTASGEVLQYDPRRKATGFVSELPLMPHPAIWGAGPDDLWVAGGSQVAHWDGRSWTTIPSPLNGVRALRGSPTRATAATALDLVPSADEAGAFRSRLTLSTADSRGELRAEHAPGQGTDLVLSTGRSATREAVRVTGSGNVGVGTAAPTARLEVQGDAHVAGEVSGPVILTPQAEARCEPATAGRLVLLKEGLFLCGPDGKPRQISR